MNSIQDLWFEISIVIDGQRLPIYQKDGRYFIAGEAGKPYAIVVRNRGNRRIEILESVDGRNALQDEAASLGNRGMIVSGGHTWDNHGWRINDNETRDFVFGDPTSSIAAQATGSAANVGVIGVAVFAEKQSFVGYTMRNVGAAAGNWATTDSLDVGTIRGVSNLAGSRSLSADMGTGMGEARADSVGHTTFERASSTPAYSIEIQYRSMAWLIEQGIVGSSFPSAWPGSNTGYGQYIK